MIRSIALGVSVMSLACAVAPADEKHAATDQSLTLTNPVPIVTFPDGNALARPSDNIGNSCLGWHGGRSFIAKAVADTSDPGATGWTHSYTYNVQTPCASNDPYCQHTMDLFAIPGAHGYKYFVKEVGETVDTKAHWYLQGIARAGQSWSMKPWYATGGSKPSATTNGAHPAYGTDTKSQDWLALWNVGYTWAGAATALPGSGGVTGPNYGMQITTGKMVESTIVPCASVYVETASGLELKDFFDAADLYDPTGHNW